MESFIRRVKAKQLHVGEIGKGYVGWPIACSLYRDVGLRIDTRNAIATLREDVSVGPRRLVKAQVSRVVPS
jgi:UDP-N-acetyl-D-mannosaminuronate dehydrogenase